VKLGRVQQVPVAVVQPIRHRLGDQEATEHSRWRLCHNSLLPSALAATEEDTAGRSAGRCGKERRTPPAGRDFGELSRAELVEGSRAGAGRHK